MPTVLCYITQGGYCQLNRTISSYEVPVSIRFSVVTQVAVKFYILLTVHLGVILVNNQLDALFYMYLFHFSTCFEQPSAHHQENQLY
jgi:hypothetical protein